MTAAIANTTTTVTAGEGGLGPYISFCESMASTCESGLGVVEATLSDMSGRGWFGPKTVNIETGRDQLAAAQQSFMAAAAALRDAIAVAEAYDANEGAGDRESVTNR
jgi:hypothetical protein